MERQKLHKKTDVLSASEIGQYRYCSYAWLLQRCGYEPGSPFLESGKQTHISLGKTIDEFDIKMRYARLYMILSIVLCTAFLLLLFGVIL